MVGLIRKERKRFFSNVKRIERVKPVNSMSSAIDKTSIDRCEEFADSQLLAHEDEDGALASCLARQEREGLPRIMVYPAQGKLLNILAQSNMSRRILEIGTLGGYSAILLARAIKANGGGQLVSLEISERNAEIARASISQAGLSDIVNVVVGTALDSLAKMSPDTDSFDFVFIDADKENCSNYFNEALRLTHPGALIVVDNVIRPGNIWSAEQANGNAVTAGRRAVIELVGGLADKVDATVIQTVSTKGHDGWILARVK